MTGRYLLFSGAHYYPEGGWYDFRGSFATAEEAKAAYRPYRFGGEWAHVVDTETETRVAHANVATFYDGPLNVVWE
jgi:hypothetical protein